MIIVIDGYNLLKLLHGKETDDVHKRSFISLMGRYIKRRNHKVIVVFDAGPCRYPMHEKYHGIQVIYSGEYKTADDVIIQFVDENKQKEMLVVTRDREIISAIKGFDKEAMNPMDFYKTVQNVFEMSQKKKRAQYGDVKKTSEDSTDDLDSLMIEASMMKDVYSHSDEDDIIDYHKPKGNASSKKNKKFQKIVDKL